jgi:hypothetical protein
MYTIEPAEVFDDDHYPCMEAGIMQSSKCSQTAMLVDFMRNSGTKFDNMKRYKHLNQQSVINELSNWF